MPHPLETERLLLRPFTLDDVDIAYAVLEGHPDVWKYDPGYLRTKEERAAFIRLQIETNLPDNCGTLAVVQKERNAFLGHVGLQLYVLPSEPFATPEVELYYKFGREYWGEGYATEACQAMIRFAFDEMHLLRIVTLTDQHNERSIRLLQRLGMRIENAPPKWAGSMIGILENDQRK